MSGDDRSVDHEKRIMQTCFFSMFKQTTHLPTSQKDQAL